MTNKIVIILAIVFVGLLSLTAAPELMRVVNKNNPNIPSFADEIPEDIEKFTITNIGQENITVRKNNDIWEVNGFKADQNKVSQLLNNLSSLQVDTLVSSNPEKFNSYGASDSAMKLELEGSGQTKGLIVGLPGLQSGTVYLRPADANQVYLVRSPLRSSLLLTIDEWRDKTIVNLNKDQIKEIIVTRGSQKISVSPNAENKWYATLNAESRLIGDVALDRLLKTLKPLSGSGFASESQQRLFAQGRGEVQIQVMQKESDQILNFTMVKDASNSVWIVKPDDQELYYRLPEVTVTDLVDNVFALYL